MKWLIALLGLVATALGGWLALELGALTVVLAVLAWKSRLRA